MSAALIDTNVFFAGASARDEYHDRAQEIIRGVDHRDLPEAIVTNYVIAETLNLIGERLGPAVANQLLDRLVQGAHFEIGHTTRSDFNAAQSRFQRYDELSFVDSTIVAYMTRNDVEYLYSFDDDFDAVEEITRLKTANHP